MQSRSDDEFRSAVGDDSCALESADAVVDMDADETACPACGTAMPGGVLRCPSCLLRFG